MPAYKKNIYHPLTHKTIDLGKTDEYIWMTGFLQELKHQRKFALRLGRVSDGTVEYNLKYQITKKLFRGEIGLPDITAGDFEISLEQKGVDMRIGVFLR